MSFIACICSFLIMGIRPFLGPAHCKFYPSCTQYALQQLAHKPFISALKLIVKRVFLCNPFTKNT